MRITESATMLTDYALGVLVLFWAALLFRLNRRDRQCSRLLWAIGFVATAAGSFFGGTFHGFRTYLTDPAAAALWKCSIYSIGIASWAMFSAIIVATVQGRWRRWLLAVVALKLLLFAAWINRHSEFRFVILDYASAMIGVLIAQAHACSVRRQQSAPWIIAGIIVGFFAALTQMSRFAINAHFNHNDLFHVIQAVGFYLFYRGGRLLSDRSDAAQQGANIGYRGESGRPR